MANPEHDYNVFETDDEIANVQLLMQVTVCYILNLYSVSIGSTAYPSMVWVFLHIVGLFYMENNQLISVYIIVASITGAVVGCVVLFSADNHKYWWSIFYSQSVTFIDEKNIVHHLRPYATVVLLALTLTMTDSVNYTTGFPLGLTWCSTLTYAVLGISLAWTEEKKRKINYYIGFLFIPFLIFSLIPAIHVWMFLFLILVSQIAILFVFLLTPFSAILV